MIVFAGHTALVAFNAYLLSGLCLLPLLIGFAVVGARLPAVVLVRAWSRLAAALVLTAYLLVVVS